MQSHRRLAAGRRVHRHARGRLRRAHPCRRQRDAGITFPPLPQLHPRQRRDAEGRRLLAVPLPDLLQDARRAGPNSARPGSAASGQARRSSSSRRAARQSASGSRRSSPRSRQQYTNIFRGNEEITLSDRALAFMVSELAKYDFTRTDVDAKGAAYQEIVGTNLRGDRGQYFTPRGPSSWSFKCSTRRKTRRSLDPACGTGGFLVATLGHMLKKFRDEENTRAGSETTTEFLNVQERLQGICGRQLFGADFDPFLDPRRPDEHGHGGRWAWAHLSTSTRSSSRVVTWPA